VDMSTPGFPETLEGRVRRSGWEFCCSKMETHDVSSVFNPDEFQILLTWLIDNSIN
jgi:hypothetical protein